MRNSVGMSSEQYKADLTKYLQGARAAIVWKLDGLSEYDVRRPMTPTGTNLLGMVKHLANVEAGYFGETFGRPFDGPIVVWDADTDPTTDMWATAAESRADIVGLYGHACAHADATIDALDLDAIGRVPWWPAETQETTLHRLLVHVIAETNRHGGHADIIRELIDGAVGLREGSTNVPDQDGEMWSTYRQRLEELARAVGEAQRS
jgi:uncharacterized damage-inducible protein DinB